MTRDEAAAILALPRAKAIDAILDLASKADKFDQLCDILGPNTPSSMKPVYLKPPGKSARENQDVKRAIQGLQGQYRIKSTISKNTHYVGVPIAATI